MAANRRPGDLGILYAASGAAPLPTYADRKNVTQGYILLGSTYTQMTTVTSGGVDTSKPFVDATLGLTLDCSLGFDAVTEYTIKLQGRRWDQISDPNAWFDIQTVNEADPSVTVAAQEISGSAQIKRVALQTASHFTTGQIRIVAYYSASAGELTTSDFILIRGMVG